MIRYVLHPGRIIWPVLSSALPGSLACGATARPCSSAEQAAGSPMAPQGRLSPATLGANLGDSPSGSTGSDRLNVEVANEDLVELIQCCVIR